MQHRGNHSHSLVCQRWNSTYTFYATGSKGGTVDVESDSSFAEFNPEVGFQGTATFIYYVVDSDGVQSNFGDVSFPIVLPPVVVDQEYTTLLTGIQITLQTNPPGEDVTYRLTSEPSGSLTLVSNGVYNYVPITAGADYFTYLAVDNAAPFCTSTTDATVNISIIANTAVSFTTCREVPVSGYLFAVGLSPYTYTLQSNPAFGSVSLDASANQFTYTPNSEQVGTVSFSYEATSSDGVVTTFTTEISVEGPTVGNSCGKTRVGSILRQILPITGTGPFTVSITTPPSFGTLILYGQGTDTISFSFTSDSPGCTWFQYQATDTNGCLSNLGVVRIKVKKACCRRR